MNEDDALTCSLAMPEVMVLNKQALLKPRSATRLQVLAPSASPAAVTHHGQPFGTAVTNTAAT